MPSSANFSSLIPFVVGLCGNVGPDTDPQAARAMVRAIWSRLDLLYPSSPKILLSALTNDLDRIAAEEALQRPGWRVAAPMPMAREVFVAGMEKDHRAWFEDFSARKGVNTYELPPLATAETNGVERTAPLLPDDEAKARVEQASLYVAGHSHLLVYFKLALDPTTVARDVRAIEYKLHGRLDVTARDVVERSCLLYNPAILDDIASGPVWQVETVGATLWPHHDALENVRVLDAETGERNGQGRFAGSIPLAERIDTFNRDFEGLDRRRDLQLSSVDYGVRDANSVLRAFGDALSTAQFYAQRNMRRTVWALPLLFMCSAFAFEIWLVRSAIAFGQMGIAIYGVFVFGAVVLYWLSTLRRWQLRAEEYRAVVEALRVQVAWWDYGLTGCDYRVDQYYLSGARGSFRMVRFAVHGLVNAATIMAAFAKPDPNAHFAWIASQVEFFEARIASRRFWLYWSERLSWGAFLVGLFVATGLLALQTLNDWGAGAFTPRPQAFVMGAKPLKEAKPIMAVKAVEPVTAAKPIKSVVPANASKAATTSALDAHEKPQPIADIDAAQDLRSAVVAVTRLPANARTLITVYSLLLFASIVAWSWNFLTGRPRSSWLEGAIVIEFFGLVLIMGLADLWEIWFTHSVAAAAAAQHPISLQVDKWGAGPSPRLDVAAGIATLCAAIVASCRYIMEKFSWRSELHSYEEALDVFKRAQTQITAIETSGWTHAEREHAYRRIVFAVGKQALSENERWLRAHRERPLEPVFST
jgi:hypothetical protein